MDTIQNPGLEASVRASLALADTALQEADSVLLGAMSSAEFEALAKQRRTVSTGSGSVRKDMAKANHYTTPETVPNQFVIEAETKQVNGVSFEVPQTTLTLGTASASDAVLSNQELIMFETEVIDVTTSDNFYLKADLSSTPILWSNLDVATQKGYLEDKDNNLRLVADKVTQTAGEYVVTDLGQDFAKEDWEAAIISAGYAQDASPYIEWTKGTRVCTSVSIVQRRNQGAYHPAYNSKGCLRFTHQGGTSAAPWYATDLVISSILDCFTSSNKESSIAGRELAGSVGGNAGWVGRSDGKFYDAIGLSDIHDIRCSTLIVPKSELRETAKREGIAGEAEGFEGVPFSLFGIGSTYGMVGKIAGANGKLTIDKSVHGDNPEYMVGKYLHMIRSDNSDLVSMRILSYVERDSLQWDVFVDNLPSTAWVSTSYAVIATKQPHSQANPTWTDIIGDPARIAATFPNGVEGQWIPVVSPSVNAFYGLNRKSLSSTTDWRLTDDDGSTWGSVADSPISTITNGFTYTLSASRIALLHYETQAHFTQDDVNSKVLDLGGVFGYGGYHLSTWGSSLHNSLLGKVATSSTNGTGFSDTYMEEVIVRGDNGLLNGGAGPTDNNINHPIVKPAPSNGSTGSKALDYLSSDNGVAKLCYAYKEMVYDSGKDSPSDFTGADGNASVSYTSGTTYQINNTPLAGVWRCTTSVTTVLGNGSYWAEVNGTLVNDAGTVYFEQWNGNGWGDNNQFEIVDNQSTITDDNGNTCLYGTASRPLKFRIKE